MSPEMWHEIVVVGGAGGWRGSHNIHEMEDSWLESWIEKFSKFPTPAQLDWELAWPDIIVMGGSNALIMMLSSAGSVAREDPGSQQQSLMLPVIWWKAMPVKVILLTNFSLKSSEWTRAFLALRRMFWMSSWSERGVTSWKEKMAWFLTKEGSIPQGLTHFGLGPLRLRPLFLVLECIVGLATTTSDSRATTRKKTSPCDVRLHWLQSKSEIRIIIYLWKSCMILPKK